MKNPGTDLLRWIRLLAVACVASGCGASARAGRGATEGAVTELRRLIDEERALNGAPMERIARSATRGTLDELSNPIRQAELAQLTRAAAGGALASLGFPEDGRAWGGGPMPDALGQMGDRFSMGFTLGLSRQLQAQLGPSGEGPLGRSFAGLAGQASAAAARGLAAELPAGAALDKSSPLDNRVYDLSRSAASGFADGIAGALRWPLLAASFAAGLFSALVLLFFTRRRFDPAQGRPASRDWS